MEFVALIIRNRMYTLLKEGERTLADKPNYMTVPAAIKELEKIEMTRQTDNVYRLDHGVTKKQKRILQAFSVDVPLVTYWAKEISKELKEVSKKAKKGAGEECEKERKRNIGPVGPTSNHQQGCWFVTNFRCF